MRASPVTQESPWIKELRQANAPARALAKELALEIKALDGSPRALEARIEAILAPGLAAAKAWQAAEADLEGLWLAVELGLPMAKAIEHGLMSWAGASPKRSMLPESYERMGERIASLLAEGAKDDYAVLFAGERVDKDVLESVVNTGSIRALEVVLELASEECAKRFGDPRRANGMRVAIFHGHAGLCDRLLRAGCPMDGESGDSSIREAISKGKPEVCAVLMAHGAWEGVDEAEARRAMFMSDESCKQVILSEFERRSLSKHVVKASSSQAKRAL